MDPTYERRKKSDKARDKAGMPSAAHARRYEALMEKKASATPVKSGKKKWK